MFKSIVAASAAGLKAFGRAIPSMLRDAAGLCGVGLITYGAWLIYPPAGFITGGILLVVGVYLLSASAVRGGS